MPRSFRDFFKRNLRRAVRVREAVDFLERIRELRVAEAAEQRCIDDGDDQVPVTRQKSSAVAAVEYPHAPFLARPQLDRERCLANAMPPNSVNMIG